MLSKQEFGENQLSRQREIFVAHLREERITLKITRYREINSLILEGVACFF